MAGTGGHYRGIASASSNVPDVAQMWQMLCEYLRSYMEEVGKSATAPQNGGTKQTADTGEQRNEPPHSLRHLG